MPAPYEVFPRLAGIVGSVAGAGQCVADWLQMCRMIMHSASNKDKTDWQIYYGYIVPAGGAGMIEALTSTVYAMLVGNVSANAELDWIVIDDDAGGGATFDGTAGLVNTVKAVHQIPACAVAGVEEFQAFVYPLGLVVTTDLLIMADGRDGTDTGATDVRVWLLYRTN